MKYDNKTVFVVGGSSGIGLAAANHLARAGANIALFARNQNTLETAHAEVTACRNGGDRSVRSYCLDASNAAETHRVMGQAVADLGVPDILINSAGGATPQRFSDITTEQLEKTIASNLMTVWNPCKALASFMENRGFGTIINVSSVAGLIGVYGYTDYSMTKFGVIGFSESLRSELKPSGVNVQVLCPPDTDTPGFESENKTKPAETHALSAGAKLMSAEAVAKALIANIGTKRFIILSNRPSKVFYALRRLSSRLTFGEIDRIIAKAQKHSK